MISGVGDKFFSVRIKNKSRQVVINAIVGTCLCKINVELLGLNELINN